MSEKDYRNVFKQMMNAITSSDRPTLEDYKAAYRSLEYVSMGEYSTSFVDGIRLDGEDHAYLCNWIVSMVCAEPVLNRQ